jgi:uncharacterized protein (DUF433 family)
MSVRWQDHIEERKDVMLGKPVFKGTRLTVEHVLRELGTGTTQDDLLRNYPRLKPEHHAPALRRAWSSLSTVATLGACFPVSRRLSVSGRTPAR